VSAVLCSRAPRDNAQLRGELADLVDDAVLRRSLAHGMGRRGGEPDARRGEGCQPNSTVGRYDAVSVVPTRPTGEGRKVPDSTADPPRR